MKKFNIGDIVKFTNDYHSGILLKVGIVLFRYQNNHSHFFTTIQERYNYSDSTLSHIRPTTDLRKL